jgi:Sec7-like guanine-nucleotide exchange factor
MQAFGHLFYEANRPSESMIAEHVALAEQAGVPASPSIADGAGHLFPSGPDLAFVLTYSCIQLNTDAHNPSIKKSQKMTLEGFLKNNR